MTPKVADSAPGGGKTVLLGFSGGLDTSYCLVALKERGWNVISAIVNTGGLLDDEMAAIEQRARNLGAAEHIAIDARETLFGRFVSYLIKADYLRNGVYPSCVGVERMLQAELITQTALERGAAAIAHGATGAGNDHVRFDVVIRALAPALEIIALIRDEAHTREEERDYLADRGFPVSEETTKYSVNSGMVGTTIGGAETYGSWDYLPEDAWQMTQSIENAPDSPQDLTIAFEQGVPAKCTFIPAGQNDAVAVSGGFELLQQLNELGAKHGVGRGVHTGQTIMGIPGRLGFEAPGMMILIDAHRELERLVLSNRQQSLKAVVGSIYGDMLHEALYYDPLMHDIEAFLDSGQERVTGEVRVRLHKGNIIVLGTKSPFSLLDGSRKLGSTYGYGSTMWSGEEARGFARIYAAGGMVAKLSGEASSDASHGFRHHRPGPG